MSASLRLSWREGVSADSQAAGEIRIGGDGSTTVLRDLNPIVAQALSRFDPGIDENQTADELIRAEGPVALARWYQILGRLARRGLIDRSVVLEGKRLATQCPTATTPVFTPATLVADSVYRLSRFAYFRREGDRLIGESPLAHGRLVFDDVRALCLIGASTTSGTVRELVDRSADLPADALFSLIGLCVGAGLIQEEGGESSAFGDRRRSLLTWEFHDLLFHVRSRKGRSGVPSGATFRMVGRIDPPPALREQTGDFAVDLDRADPASLEREDGSLADILERRRSVREYDSRPIALRELGRFLDRTVRAKGRREVEVPTPRALVKMDFAPRPYPSGGGLYELEFYVAVNACEGLAPGLYRYDAGGHRLFRLQGMTTEVDRLLRDAAGSAGIARESVQVLIVLASRFSRIAWKYEAIAYALTLKHAGVVFQTMYLVATAMGLAPCALGGGDADLFAQAAGTDYYDETSVGEFLLGGRPKGERAGLDESSEGETSRS